MDSATWNEPFLNGKGGIIIDVQSRAPQLINLFKETDPDDFEQYVDVTGNLRGPQRRLRDAHRHRLQRLPSRSRRRRCSTEEELRAVLTVLDPMNTKEAPTC